MSLAQKKCSICAQEIPLETSKCPYCGAHFKLVSTGYCQNCHEVREADEEGKCKVCDNTVVDWRVESRFVEAAPAQAVHSAPAPPPIMPRRSGERIWIVRSLLTLVALGLLGAIFWLSKGSMSSLSNLFTTNTPALESSPVSTTTPVPSKIPTPTTMHLVWKQLSVGLDFPRTLVTEVVLNPLDPNIILFGAREDTSGTQTYLSTDQGQSWQEISATGYRLVYNADGTVLYRGGDNKILFSEDNGRTWNRLSPPVNGILSIATHPLHPAILFALYKYRADPFFYSEDGGRNWTNAKGGFIHSHVDFPHLFFSLDGNVVYSLAGPSRSGDGGHNWQSCGGWEVGTRISVNSGSPSAMLVDPNNSDTLFAVSPSGGIRISRDKCQNWNHIDRGLSDKLVNTIAIDPNHRETFYAGTAEHGVFVSFNSGAYWEAINDGLPRGMMIYSIVVDSESNVYAATARGLFTLERDAE